MAKVDKGHWLEVSDRINIIQHNIEDFVEHHPSIYKKKKYKKYIHKAQKALGKLYQKTANNF